MKIDKFLAAFQCGHPIKSDWRELPFEDILAFHRYDDKFDQFIRFLNDDMTDWVFVECPRNTIKLTPNTKVRYSIMLDLLKKSAAKFTNQVAEFEVADADFAKKYPYLYAFLTANIGPDKKPRDRATLSFFAEGGTWKAAFNDKDSRASLFVTLGKPQDLFGAIEHALEKEQPEWRPWRNPERGKGK